MKSNSDLSAKKDWFGAFIPSQESQKFDKYRWGKIHIIRALDFFQ